LATGVKSDNLVIIAPVAIAAITQYLRGTTDTSGPKFGVAAVVLTFPVVALGAFWYIRAWIVWKNPFYPIDLLGFHGYGTIQQLIIGNNVPQGIKSAPLGYLGQVVASWLTDLQHHPYYYDSRPGGFGLQWLFILAPALIYLLIYTFRYKWEFFWFLCLPVIIVLVLTSEPWMARYSMSLFVLASSGFAVILERFQMARYRLLRYADAALRVSFVVLTFVTLVWANTPTVYSTNVDGYPTYLTISQLVRDAINGNANKVIEPWPEYAAVDRLPVDSTIAFSGLDSPMFTYPLVGTHFTRSLVRLPYSGTSARQLALSMRQVGANYLILGITNGDKQLFRNVSNDLLQFRPLTKNDTVNGQDLFELGNWKACSATKFVLTGVNRLGLQLRVTARLTSSCGPEVGRPVFLWEGQQNTPLYTGPRHIVMRGRTNVDGIVRFKIDDVKRSLRYFLRQPGGYVAHVLYAPAATAPFTYAFVPVIKANR
jgi:hypothetical protein